MKNEKMLLLADFLGVDVAEITGGYKAEIFEAEGNEYLVLTEEEREKEVLEYIKESVWAFNSNFLANETDLPEEVFLALNNKCESGNEAILKLIEKTCGITEFVQEAVKWDGYGHFLSPYDGEEEELGEYYLYRIN